jgi:hypothetical protein
MSVPRRVLELVASLLLVHEVEVRGGNLVVMYCACASTDCRQLAVDLSISTESISALIYRAEDHHEALRSVLHFEGSRWS